MKPDRVKSNFGKRLSTAVCHHSQLMVQVGNNKNQAAIETMLVEQFVMLSAVQWESFLNDLIIAYVVEDPDSAVASLKKRIENSTKQKFGEQAAKCMSFEVKKPIAWDRVVGLLDPDAYNITFASANELSSKANDYLGAMHAKKFSLGKSDSQFINYTVALRNYLSHRSNASRQSLKAAIAALTEPDNVAFKAKLVDIGTYLKTKDGNNVTRAVAFSNRLIQISQKL